MNATTIQLTPDTEGVFYDLPSAQYHSAPGVSQSMLRLLARSPAHLRASLDVPRESTPAMIFGTAVHHLLLTPDAPWTWALRPTEMDLRSSGGKAWKKAVVERLGPDAPIITLADWMRVEGCVAAVRAHPIAARALANAKTEVSVFKKFTIGGATVQRRARLDIVTPGNVIADIKTIEDARPEAVAKSVFGDLRYYVQGAYYLDIWNDTVPDQPKDLFLFIAVEKDPPHAVSVTTLSPEAIEMGRAEYSRLLPIYATCVEFDDWPSYPETIETLTPPAWARKKNPLYV